MSRIFKSHLQSSFGGRHKNFEAIVLEGQDLWHWWRNNDAAGAPWQHGQRIIEGRAAFAASMIQSDFGSSENGNFEVVAGLRAADGSVELWHVWHDNSDVNLPWQFGQRITEAGRRVLGPACIIQSNFGGGEHGNFEVIVPVLGDDGVPELRHYWHDNSDVNLPWNRGQRVNDPSHAVIGSGCLIQSNFGDSDHGNFEVAAWVALPDGRRVLQHYWHDNSDVGLPWRNGQIIAFDVHGNGVLIQSDFGSEEHGNFEVAVPVQGPEGRTYVQHFWHDNSDVESPWRPGQVITEVGRSDGGVSLFQSDYNDGGHGNFEVLLEECRQSLVDYWHPNVDVNLPWIRHATLLGEQADREVRQTQRICQLTGEFDRTGWNGQGDPPLAFNRTESRFGLRGTDLGVSFEHKNRIFFLFGDTWRLGEDRDSHFDWDAIAWCTDTQVNGGLSLTFSKQPPVVHNISQGAFEVPLDGFSHRGQMFAFFSTDHRSVGDAELMGRSVLAVSDNDGFDFRPLIGFSNQKFINVSVSLEPLDEATAQSLGWHAGTPVLWLWGSGRYRASAPYLAVMQIDRLFDVLGGRDDVPTLPELGQGGELVKYLAGNGQGPRWSANEWEAVPLFCAGDVGELSCRRNAVFDRYFFTYNTGNPRGIVLRHSQTPWGPWSGAILIFDPGWVTQDHPKGIGYGNFMHRSWTVAHDDNVQDDMFLSGRRDNEWGGEYGPYQITRFSTGIAGEWCDLHYTMSTWNPYESMLMRTRLTRVDLV